MSVKLETRTYQIEELRASDENGTRRVGGYAAVFDKLSEDLGMFVPLREKIQRGAFSDSIMNGDIRAFWNHNHDIVLGRNKNQSLTLSEDSHGLSFDLQLADTQAGNDAFKLIQRGDVSAMSFGFQVKKDSWERPKNENEPIIRTLLDVNLLEVSPVAFPAYPQTDVGARSLTDFEQQLREKLEEFNAKEKSEGKEYKDFLVRQAQLELSIRFQRDVFFSC